MIIVIGLYNTAIVIIVFIKNMFLSLLFLVFVIAQQYDVIKMIGCSGREWDLNPHIRNL